MVTQGGVAKAGSSSMSSFPPRAARLCLGCTTQAGMGMVQHRLHPGLGQTNPARELAPLPFPKIPAVTPLLEKPVFPEASSHPWHTAPAPCPGKHPAPETALAGGSRLPAPPLTTHGCCHFGEKRHTKTCYMAAREAAGICTLSEPRCCSKAQELTILNHHYAIAIWQIEK